MVKSKNDWINIVTMVLEKEMLHVERLHSQLDLSKSIIKNLIY